MALEARAADERSYYAANRRIYDSWLASIYDATMAPLRHVRNRAVRAVPIVPGTTVLDVATGTGAQARAFAEAGARVVGIDLSPRMLAIAQRKDPDQAIQYIEGDASALPLADATFDVACVSFALHEMPASVREQVVGELARVTRPGGWIVIIEPDRSHRRVWGTVAERTIALFERDSYREFVHSNLSELLARHGIRIVDEQRVLLDTARVVVARA